MAVKLNVKVPKVLKSVKYCLAGINGVFLLTGLLLLAAGVTVMIMNTEYEDLITQRFFNIPAFTIATAVIILLGSTLGFYAAISEQFYVIVAYVALLLMVLVFEVSLVIAAFSLNNKASTEIRTTMLESLKLYGTRNEITIMWDNLQTEFECCGVAGRFDYISNQIPVSCCHIDYGTISPFECLTTNAYPDGCADMLGEWLSYNIYVIAMCAVVATGIQVLLSALGGWMAWRSKFEEVELES